MIKFNGPQFRVGQVVSTPGAIELMEQHRVTPRQFLERHVTGDWGDICDEDKGLNEQALKDGERIMSVYHLAANETIWVITEADRSSTCLLLPEEY